MIVLQGTFPIRSEAFGIKLIYDQRPENVPGSPDTATVAYIPYSHTRRMFVKNIRFVGQIRGKKISDLMELAKKPTENQKFVVQSENQENILVDGAVEAYFLIHSSMMNPKTFSLAGGWIANPRSKTASWEFMNLANDVRSLIRGAADKAYPEWEGNLDMDQDDYSIKNVIITAPSASGENSTKKPTAEQPGDGQPAAQPADKDPARDQPSTPTSKDAPRQLDGRPARR